MAISKKNRQKRIADLVSMEKIRGQDGLGKRLAEIGIVASQSTISRDMVEMNIFIGSRGFYEIDKTSAENRRIESLRSLLVDHVEILKNTDVSTLPIPVSMGYAYPLGELISEIFPELIWGSIPSNTYLIIFTKGRDAKKQLKEKLKHLISEPM